MAYRKNHACPTLPEEMLPGTLAYVKRRVRPHADNGGIVRHTFVIVLCRAWEPPEQMTSSLSYGCFLGEPHNRFDILAHVDLVLAASS